VGLVYPHVLYLCTTFPLCIVYSREMRGSLHQTITKREANEERREMARVADRQTKRVISQQEVKITYICDSLHANGGLAPGIGECQKGMRLLCMVNHVYKYAPVLV